MKSISTKHKWKASKSTPEKDKVMASLGKKMLNSDIARLQVRVPWHIHKVFRKKCVEQRKPMAEVINFMILNYIDKK